MRNLIATFAVVLAASALACGAPDRDGEAGDEQDVVAGSGAPILVWTDAAAPRSERLAEDGTVLSSASALQIALRSGVIEMRTERKASPLSCELDFGGEPQRFDGSYEATGLAFVHLDSLEPRTVVPLAPLPDDNEYIDFQQSPAVTATVGPFVFVRTETYSMGCGAAHGGVGVQQTVWNALTGAEVELAVDIPEEATAKAKKELDGKGFPDSEVRLAEIVPTFGAGGQLSLDYRFEMDACYACSDGLGSSYSVSAIVHATDLATPPPLPAELAPYATPPQAVARWLAAEPSRAMHGWSSGQ